MRKTEKDGFALLEAVIIVMIFTILASVLYGLAGMEQRAVMARVREDEAYYAAVSAVRLMSDEITGKTQEESETNVLTNGDGMEKQTTFLEFKSEDGIHDVLIPVLIWSERNGNDLVLAAEAESGGTKKLVTLRLEGRAVLEEETLKSESGAEEASASDAEAVEEMIWIPVAYETRSK